ncbi:MAG: sugar phosphate nucleotidyltransferase [Clostridiales bacterium]|nr:sugar phosphate nucleotidyltransferase [Clostridiales bacterium]
MPDNKKTALVIMAAGVGSRFGKGVKQLTPVGPEGELIMDYSIKDAVRAGFNKVVFITRKDLYDDFRKLIGDRVAESVEVEYAFQEISDIPQEFSHLLADRAKPWGTGQAVLSIKEVVNEPFIVINADDYYGQECFEKVHDFLVEDHDNSEVMQFCMAGYYLRNTLSDFGSVTRGVCKVDDEGYLQEVEETYEIYKTENGAESRADKDNVRPIDINSPVSMNMWGLYPEFLEVLEKGFRAFLSELKDEDVKKEYLLPQVIGNMVKKGAARVRVLETSDKWFGVTYAEDKENVIAKIKELTDKGIY